MKFYDKMDLNYQLNQPDLEMMEQIRSFDVMDDVCIAFSSSSSFFLFFLFLFSSFLLILFRSLFHPSSLLGQALF